ncbi:MAG: sulfatase-like hydrolase/transferase [Pirellulaceae bacterium]
MARMVCCLSVRWRIRSWMLGLAVLSWYTMDPAACSADPRPNIVLVLADDLGYGDLGCYGSKELKTPHLDAFAAAGLRYTSCYAGHPNCSPSRTALMTGRTPTRVGVRNWIPEESPVHLRRSEITVATLLRGAGYATCHVGKWHLNGDFNGPTQPQPGDHGFDHWFSTQNNALPNHRHPNNFVRNGKPAGPLTGYSAPLVADEALRWLKGRDNRSVPFFLYVCFHEPHEPIATDEPFSRLYPSEDPSYSAHHGNITQMDDAFGRLMRGLDELNLRDNTLIWFTSDNGPAITAQHPHGSAGPLRDKKGAVYEGGIRVPGILQWKGHLPAGQTSDEPISGVDFLPTACAVAGIPVPQDRVLDGGDIRPTWSGQPAARMTPLYWHFPLASSETKVAMRVGDWKILATLDKAPLPRTNDITDEDERRFKTAELDRLELYNLRRDVGETTDLAATEPEKLAELRAVLQTKYREVRDESPVWPAWKFTGAEGRKIVWPEYTRQKKARAAAKKKLPGT